MISQITVFRSILCCSTSFSASKCCWMSLLIYGCRGSFVNVPRFRLVFPMATRPLYHDILDLASVTNGNLNLHLVSFSIFSCCFTKMCLDFQYSNLKSYSMEFIVQFQKSPRNSQHTIGTTAKLVTLACGTSLTSFHCCCRFLYSV